MSVSSSPFSSALCRCKAVAALALLSLAALLPAQPTPEPRAPSLPAGCEVLGVEQGHKVSLHAYAIGVQTYRWNPISLKWDFQGPTALLFADAGYQAVIGSHFSGPTWVTNSGSAVIGTRVDGRSPDATAIPWLLLRSVWNGGPGPLEGTTFIQRVNTTGGLEPARTGLPYEIVQVPYTAEYYFYRAE